MKTLRKKKKELPEFKDNQQQLSKENRNLRKKLKKLLKILMDDNTTIPPRITSPINNTIPPPTVVIPSPLPKPKPTKLRLKLLPVQGQITPDLFSKFQNYISQQIPEIELSQEGITCFVSVAITERVEQYFTSCNITSNTIPITLQRRNNPSVVPPQLKDSWGNMVVVFYSANGFEFKDKDSLMQNARKIQKLN